MVRRLHIKSIAVQEFGVQTGSGEQLNCDRKCEKVRLMIQGTRIEADIFVLDVAGCDIVLGVQWLAELGNIVANFRKMTMAFMVKGQRVEFQGEHMLHPIPLTCKTLTKVVQGESVAGIYALQCVPSSEKEVQKGEEIPEVVKTVLERYPKVFKETKELPPTRNVDHPTELMLGKGPVNVRPYRYPHF